MFLVNILVQGAIIFGLVVFFILSVILNKKTKTPEGVELPEQCQSCKSAACLISLDKVDQMKQEIIAQIQEDCPEEE